MIHDFFALTTDHILRCMLISVMSHFVVSSLKNSRNVASQSAPPPLPCGPLTNRSFCTVTGSTNARNMVYSPLNIFGASTKIIISNRSGYDLANNDKHFVATLGAMFPAPKR